MTRLGVARAFVDGAFVDGDVEAADGRIVAVGLAPAVGDRIATAGYVDLQVNGFAGTDLLLAADASVYAHVGEALAATGVTAYLPTFITARPDTVGRALRALGDAVGDRPGGPQILGAHLEGPFLSHQRAGTHPVEHLLEPDLAWLDRMLASGPVACVTLAPELPGAFEAIDHLVAADVVVACGHSDADASIAHAAFDRGARAVTHAFNGMRPLHHREPGLIGAALSRDEVFVPVIADGVHVAAEVVRFIGSAVYDRLVLVTDATAAAGCSDGAFTIGEVEVVKTGLEVRRADGTLAGSALTMDAAVRNAVDFGVPLASALDAASRAPARLLRRADIGRLVPGRAADVVVLDDELHVVRVLRDGEEIAP